MNVVERSHVADHLWVWRVRLSEALGTTTTGDEAENYVFARSVLACSTHAFSSGFLRTLRVVFPVITLTLISDALSAVEFLRPKKSAKL